MKGLADAWKPSDIKELQQNFDKTEAAALEADTGCLQYEDEMDDSAFFVPLKSLYYEPLMSSDDP